jgi:RNA-directed DNA polymerase
MKRHGNLYEKIIDIENIKLAHKNARHGKAFYQEVKMVDAEPDKYFKAIQDMLANQTFSTSEYTVEDRFDGRKMRTIYKLPYYPDRIVQHALLNVTGRILTNSLIRDTFQSITGRGTSDAMRRVKKLVRSKNAPRYALKIDVSKYYPSVDNVKMKDAVRKKIKCQKTLWLFDNIINSMQGLPIGNYTSQILGNVYLKDFDWHVKQVLKPTGYFRYCDDILFFHDSKAKLLSYKAIAIRYLRDIGLNIKDSWNIYDVYKNGVDFVGFVLTPNHTRLRKTITVNFKKTCSTLRNSTKKFKNPLNSLMAYKGWVKSCNAKHLWRKHTKCLRSTFPKQLRGAI